MGIETLKESYLKGIEFAIRKKKIYELYSIEHLSRREISEKLGILKTTICKNINIFEIENPEIISQMKKEGKNVTPEDYEKLKKEIADLKNKISQESLRADFYEEMVKFGKEVYGIDLKKDDTK